jgi:hypothetical protein
VYDRAKVTAILNAAGFLPGRYADGTAQLTWMAVVPDAARDKKLDRLVESVGETEPAFVRELHARLEALAAPAAGGRAWYHHADAYDCRFVGPGAVRAVVDRVTLRSTLRRLAEDGYRVLLVFGEQPGKSHTWLMIEHLWSRTGMLSGADPPVRVTTHTWSGAVSGEDIAGSLFTKLGLDITLAQSQESEETRVRKLLDKLVGNYPKNDPSTRWILLDGLDRPRVHESARDFARGLVMLVNAGELPRTKLVVTGMDPLGLDAGYGMLEEQIERIDAALVHLFLTDVAEHLGRTVGPGEIDGLVAEVLGHGGAPEDLSELERSLYRTLSARWAGGAR